MGFIREPAVSGMFYPADAAVLRRDIEGYLEKAVFEPFSGHVVGIVSPHAGYMYSGPVAAYAFKAIKEAEYDTAVVIAPSHRKYFDGAAIIEEGGYRTPLGVVEIDRESAKTILNRSSIVKNNIDVHIGEHSLEVQIPFLQTVLKKISIVPLIMGSQDFSTCETLSSDIFEALKDAKKRLLIVGSTDLSHYYSYAHAAELDGVVTKRLDDFDISGLSSDLAKDKCEACGAGPMITTMMLSRKLGAKLSKVLNYANSGDISGDKSAVVGYVSAVFYK